MPHPRRAPALLFLPTLLLLAACKGPDAAPAPAAAASTTTAPSASASPAAASTSAPAPASASGAKKPRAPHPIASDEGAPDEPAPPPFAPVKKPFAVTKFDAKALPPGAKIDGTLEGALAWTDAFGDNVALFTRREVKEKAGSSVFLRVHHWASSGGWKLLREIKDQSERCEFDNVTAFRRASFDVDDTDRNGVGELRFAYVVDCVSDVSPQTAKLIVLEGGAKSILRGSTLIMDGQESYGGTYTPDPAAAKWKPKLLEAAKGAWRATIGEPPK